MLKDGVSGFGQNLIQIDLTHTGLACILGVIDASVFPINYFSARRQVTYFHEDAIEVIGGYWREGLVLWRE